jgi:hypothetical protein
MGWAEWIQVLAPIITSIIALIITTLLTVAGYFARKTIDGFGTQLSAQHLEFSTQIKTVREDFTTAVENTDGKRDELEKEFLRFQAQLPRVYVLKDDHIRHVTILEKKIDDLAGATNGKLSGIEADIKQLLRESPKRTTDG